MCIDCAKEWKKPILATKHDRSHLFSLREGFVGYLFFCFASRISRCSNAETAKWPFLFVKLTGIYFVLLLDGITFNICSIKNRTIFLPNVEKQNLMFKKAVNSYKQAFIFVIKLHILWRFLDFKSKMVLLNVSYDIYRLTATETVPVFSGLSYKYIPLSQIFVFQKGEICVTSVLLGEKGISSSLTFSSSNFSCFFFLSSIFHFLSVPSHLPEFWISLIPLVHLS